MTTPSKIEASTLVEGETLATHTPGPWAWYGNSREFYLATVHSGRRYVMGFKRRGLNGAQPTFQVGKRMVPADALCKFEVGDKSVRGFAEAKKNTSVYRTEVFGIDAPDARLIAAAPDLLAELREARDNGLIYWSPNTARGHEQKALMLARINALLAKVAP